MGQYQFCPQCGARLDTRPGAMRRLARGVGQWRAARSTTLESTALAPWQPEPPAPVAPGHSMTAIRQTPVRGQNLEADLATPFLQAIATGLFVSILGLYLAWVRQGVLWHHGIIAGVVAAGIYWLLTLSWNRKLLWLVEEIIQSDVDGDGQAGQPAALQQQVTTLEMVHRDDGIQRRRFDLPDGMTEVDLIDFASGVLVEHRGLAESSWTGRGRPFSKPKYRELLDVLGRAGLVAWVDDKNHAQGRKLTWAGRHALTKLIETARTHTHAGSGDTLIGKYEVIGEG